MDIAKATLSDICEKMASTFASQVTSHELSVASSNSSTSSQADALFQEALQHNPQNISAMLGLAKLCRERGDMEQCQNQCRKIISADPSQEEATVLLSETLFLGKDSDSAVTPLENLLRAHPNNYRAMERLLFLLRRSGKLEEAPEFFTAASKVDKRCLSHAGFRFCQGLYARFTNDVGKVCDNNNSTSPPCLYCFCQAISEFNLARKDDVWGASALTHMIELYLNPDQDGAWEEKEGVSGGPLDDAVSENIAVAEALLRELRPKAKYNRFSILFEFVFNICQCHRDPLRFQVLENYCLLATKQKFQVS